MKIDKKKILVLGGLLTLISAILLLRSGRDSSENGGIVSPAPLPTQIEIVEVESQTGALYISPTADEKKINDSIRILRDSCPIQTDDFSLDFDYKKYVFVVKTEKEGAFWRWLDVNGYVIPIEKFVIK